MVNSSQPKNKKVIILTIVFVLILLAIVVSFLVYKNIESKKITDQLAFAFDLGYNKSVIDISTRQTNSGVIFVSNGTSVQIRSIYEVCQGLGFK